MRKILASIAALALMMSISISPAFADAPGGVWTSPDTIYEDERGGSPIDRTVPMKGYVGEDASITKDDGTVTSYEINVSVPTTVLWAAFASEGGTISSPTYEIINNSSTRAVRVTLVSVGDAALNGITAANKVQLNISNVAGGGSDYVTMQNKNNITNGGGAGTALITSLAAKKKIRFEFKGTVSSDQFNAGNGATKQPTWNMMLQFENLTY
jgi:hypothetical protein